METRAALLILLASLAIGITSAAFLSKRYRGAWRRIIARTDSPYRAGVDERVGMPTRIRVAILLSILMAVMCVFRVVVSIDDVINLTDQPHVRVALSPPGPIATMLEVTLAFVAAAAGLRLYGSARALAARRPSPHVDSAIVLLLVSATVAAATIFALTRVPIVIYWQRRMLLYLAVHGALDATTAAVLAAARRIPIGENG